MNFNINDVAVYPGKGVGRISEITDKQVDDKVYTVYVLQFPADAKDYSEITSTLEVPLNRATSQKMRSVMPSTKVEEVYHILRDREVPPNTQTWNRRYREYLAKIATGDPEEIAQVLRDLALLKAKKNLSFGERKMYDQAHTLIIEEAGHAMLNLHNSTHPDDEKSLSSFKEQVSHDIAEIFRPDEEAARLEQEAKLASKKKGAKKRAKADFTESDVDDL